MEVEANYEQDTEPNEDTLGGKLLTKDIVVRGLSELGRSFDGTSFVFTKLDISDQDLTDISELSNYPHIQHLIAKNNQIFTLTPALDELSSLIKLDVSYNELTQLLHFQSNVNLLEADFSYNRIETIHEDCLIGFQYIKVLKIQGNSIEDLAPLRYLINLTELDVSHNEVSEIGPESLFDLPLTKLYMNNNKISSIDGIPPTFLEDLALQDNNINSLHEFAYLMPDTEEIGTDFLRLQKLDIGNNVIENIDDVKYLVAMPVLRTLVLQGNPFRMNDDQTETDSFATYTHHVLNVLRQLSFLDGADITAEEKITAANMFGEDEPHRQEILKKYFAKSK